MNALKIISFLPTCLLPAIVLLLLSLSPVSLAAGQPSLPEAQPSQSLGQPSQPPENRVVRDLKDAVARVQPFLDHYGYAAVFLAILVEGFGLVAPGQTLLIAAALTAARGHLNIAWVLFWACTAAVLGNSLGYLLGLRGGRPLLRKIRVNQRHLERMEGYFSRYGKGLVLFARFFDGLRQLNGIVAGLLRMPWKVFTTFNILGAALWTCFWGLGAYWLEKKIVALHLTFHTVRPWIALASILAFLALIVHLLRRHHNNSRMKV
jgi:membrane protein DedA with SNARE-associated domain|uniref:DedA family protein n=1 Tax=Desulfobacca acetoxidans TaxID=60893 RepID=A0A7V6A3R5_9BACT